MIQRLITKYGLAFHLALIVVFPLLFMTRAAPPYSIACGWLTLLACQWLFMLPAVRRGELLSHARRRVIRTTLWDPCFYIGLGLLFFVGIQALNSGCQLVYLSDADTWRMGAPPVAWLPFSVRQGEALELFWLYLATVAVVIALRNAVGKGGKRVFLQTVAISSGAIALYATAALWSDASAWHSVVAGKGYTAVGSLFGFWFLIALGCLGEALARGERRVAPLACCGVWGNLCGLLFFSQGLPLLAFQGVGLLLFIYWIWFVMRHAGKGVALVALLLTSLALGVAAALVCFSRQPEVAHKYLAAFDLPGQWELWSGQHGIRIEKALSIWQEYPWRGTGREGFTHFAGLFFDTAEWKLLGDDRANVYCDGVQFLCEYGIVGTLLLLALVVSLLIPFALRARRLHLARGTDKKRENYLMLLSPIVVTALPALLLLVLESTLAFPFRSAALFISWLTVLAVVPAFIPEKIR